MGKAPQKFQSRLQLTLLVTIGSWLVGAQVAGAQIGAGVVPLPGANWGPAEADDETTTYASHVAPILQENCVICHRTGSIGPMSLVSYEQAKQFAPLIKSKVANRLMPPWPLDKSVGIQQFKNDISLTDDEIATIVRWVDEGAPLGDPAALPEPLEWPEWEDAWKYGEVFNRPPDMVIRSPAYTVVANGMDQTPPLRATLDELREERWIRAIEIRSATPETRMVFHHANTSILMPGESSDDMERAELAASAMGLEGYIYPDDTGRVIRPGSTVSFNMHLVPIDHDVEAILELGVWFHDSEPEFETPGEVHFRISQTTGFGGFPGHSTDPQISGSWPGLVLPPNRLVTYRSTYVLDRPARIYSLRGHFHLRAKYAVLEVIYPDGRYELINKVDWAHRWHVSFLYDDDAMPLLPKGTTVLVTAVFDNTAANPGNPDPDQWVTWGPRTVDEMSHFRYGVTWFDNEEDFDRLVAERERALAEKGPIAVLDGR